MNAINKLTYYLCNENLNLINLLNPYMGYYLNSPLIGENVNINNILISIKSNYTNEDEIINNIERIFDIKDIYAINYEKIYNIKNKIIKNINILNEESIIYYIEFNNNVSKKTFNFLNKLSNLNIIKIYNFEIKITKYNENRNFNFN